MATRSIPNANPSAQTLRYVQPDHLGSSTTLTDASGNVVARERYSAFGERRRGETPITTDQLYTGQRYNALSTLYHYSDGKSAGRFYDPLLGRFVSPDSVTPGKGSQALNRFGYNLNNPVKYTDPSGHAPCDDSGPNCGTDTTDTALTASPCPICRMDPNFDATIRFYASIYGIPPELLAATQTAEAIDDQNLPNRIFRQLNLTAATMAQMDPAKYPDYVLTGLGWVAVVDGVGRLIRPHPGIGVENFHIDTAQDVEIYFQEHYGGTSMANLVSPGKSDVQLLTTLGSPEGNIRYTAAYLRQLADIRTGRQEPHLSELADTDMAIIYTAYRAGFTAFGGLANYQTAQTPGTTLGPTFLRFLGLYKGYYR